MVVLPGGAVFYERGTPVCCSLCLPGENQVSEGGAQVVVVERGASGSETGSYVRLIVFVYHSTLGWRAIKKKRTRSVREAWKAASAW